eukprot:scaffold24719_cov48-Phaeocystis_antarctica.AAC.2
MPGGLLFLCLHQRCGGQHAGDGSLNIARPKGAHDARAFHQLRGSLFWGTRHQFVAPPCRPPCLCRDGVKGTELISKYPRS